jgi:hypothetical protein
VLARWLHCVTTLVLALIALHLALFAISLWIAFHRAEFQAAFVAITAVVIAMLVWSIVRRRRTRLDERALAALLEKHYPQLGERLLTTVQVIPEAGAHREVVAALAEATDRQMAPLDPRGAYGIRSAWVGAARAGAASALVFLLLLVPPYARYCDRLIWAWSDRSPGYHLEVMPGNAWTARGRPATVSVDLVADEPDAPLPAECILIYDEAGGSPQRVRMDRSVGSHLLSWPRFDRDIIYRIEAGEVVAGPFFLRAVEPVEVAQTSVRVVPPPYVNCDHVPVQELRKAGPLTVLQFSDVCLTVTCTARPVRVACTLRDDSTGAEVAAYPPGERCEPATAVTIQVPVHRCGTFSVTLVIEGEHGVKSTHSLPSWTVRPDGPPQFTAPVRVRGVRATKLYGQDALVSPDDPLRIEASVEDAEGVHSVALEYRVNDEPAVTVPWVDAGGRLRLGIDRAFALPRGLKEGDRFRFRLLALDNRALAKDVLGPGVPALTLAPQVAFSPAAGDKERWIEWRIGTPADSLLRKEIAEHNGDLQRGVEQVRQKLLKEHSLLGQVRQASHQRSELMPAQHQQLAEAERLNQKAVADLEQLAAKTEDVGELAALGDSLRAIIESELMGAAAAIAQARDGESAGPEREKAVQKGETAVLQALLKLNGLASLADRLAQGQLDRVEMERLAGQQQELAHRANEMLAAGKSDDAALAVLQAEQAKVAERLSELAAGSELLREAMAHPPQVQAKRLAGEMAQLAKEHEAAGSNPGGEKLEPGVAEEKLRKKMQQLADDTLKLAQQAGGPDAAKMAQQSAVAMEKARAAMEKGLASKAQGKPDEAKAMEADAMLKLALAQNALESLAGMMPGPGEAKAQTVEAMAHAKDKVQMARQKLQSQPGQAPSAMRQAAASLDRAAQQMGQQLGSSLPKVSGRPGVGAGSFAKANLGTLPAALAKELEPFLGKSWGELPGELKTQLLQDARARFGDDYAPIIQQYFEQIAGGDRTKPLPRQP